MKSRVISTSVFSIFGILIAAGPYTIFPVCPHGVMAMNCQATAKATLILGILSILIGLSFQFIRGKHAEIYLSLLGAAVGILVFLFVNVITGVCQNPHMTCRALTLPALSILSITLVLFSVLNGLYWRASSKKEVISNDA